MAATATPSGALEPSVNQTKPAPVSRTLKWSPCNPNLEEIIKVTSSNLLLEQQCVNSSKQLEENLQTYINSSLCGIEFDNSLLGDVPIPKQVDLKLRFPGELRTSNDENWYTNLLFSTNNLPGPRNPDNNEGAIPGYNQEGFLAIQKEISSQIIRYHQKLLKKDNADKNLTDIQMQRFPYPPWTESSMAKFTDILVMLVSFGALQPALFIIKRLTLDKETSVKEMMKIMGLPTWIHWVSWFITSFIIFLIGFALLVLALKIHYPKQGILAFSSIGALCLVLLIFVCATITLCFAISSFFKEANTAAAVGTVLMLLTLFPYFLTKKKFKSISHHRKMLVCLAPNSAISRAMDIIFIYEGLEVGLQWKNFWSKTSAEDSLTMGHIMIMLIVDMFLFLLVALYVDAIFPGEYGLPKPWYFPFSASFWCGQQISPGSPNIRENNNKQDSSLFEKEPSDLPVGIQIKHLNKMYSKDKVAVADLSLNMYVGQITVLLGHNGAGKTTLMSMVTGLIPPTNGTAIVNGYGIDRSMDKVRESLGFCPQNNVFFEELTVSEHLYFYSKLKGLDTQATSVEINRYISILELESKRNIRVGNLSGGMKRKVCIAIALCGNSQVVLLDEPTAGIDPGARRTVWNLLQQEKKGRTILLSSHFMDEADILGDRIAIMAAGKLQSCGTSFYLKKKFGSGLQLIIVKSPDCNVEAITQFLRTYIPNAQVKSNIGTDLTYALADDKTNIFESLLQNLEKQKSQFRIQSYGISASSLEEVFMKVGADNLQKDQIKLEKAKPSKNRTENRVNIDGIQYLDGIKLLWNQIIAIFYKRALSSWRSWTLLLAQILLPVICIIITLATSRKKTYLNDLPSMAVNNLERYVAPLTVISGSSIYKNALQSSIKDAEVLDIMNNDLSSNVLAKGKEDVNAFRQHYIIGASFFDSEIRGWFNSEPYHSAPVILQFIMNSILKTEVGSNYGIDIYNHPLPFLPETKLKYAKQMESYQLMLVVYLCFCLAVVSPLFTFFYIKERVSGAKHLQLVSGVRLYLFWLVSFLWDLLVYAIIHICIVATIAAFQEDGLKTAASLGRIFMVLMLYSFSLLPFYYVVSLVTDDRPKALNNLQMVHVLGIMAFFLLDMFLKPSHKNTYKIVNMVCLVLPHYTLCSALFILITGSSTMSICNEGIEYCVSVVENSTRTECEEALCASDDKCCDLTGNYFTLKENGIAKHIIAFLGVGLVLLVILALVERGIVKSIYNYASSCWYHITPGSDDVLEDNDVKAEKQKIRMQRKIEIIHYALVLKDVTKYYKKFKAVNNLCLRVNKFECFGLLGINGAGKTTVFKMMTGAEKVTFGDIWISGIDIRTNMPDAFKIIGYCPQFDALLDYLTGRETLIMFCLLRGIKYDQCKYLAEKYAIDFDFHKHIDKQVRKYSGGNKRKLSAALSMLGDPEIIFMDEPTAGMDPATKRFLWNNVIKARDNGKCIILTSHSMDECEALCTRLGIMVNGAFRCLGSQQQLKSKYAQGYTLQIKFKKKQNKSSADTSDVNLIDNFVKSNFPTAELREQYQDLLYYYISYTGMPWSQMFGILEKGKKELPIEDYSLGQSTLEQVFLHFTKHQVTGDE